MVALRSGSSKGPWNAVRQPPAIGSLSGRPREPRETATARAL